MAAAAVWHGMDVNHFVSIFNANYIYGFSHSINNTHDHRRRRRCRTLYVTFLSRGTLSHHMHVPTCAIRNVHAHTSNCPKNKSEADR